jgi:hypothetical protein
MPRVERTAPSVLVEVDFGDAELFVREHPDGKFTIDLNDERVVATADQMRDIVAGFVRIAQEKQWT